MTISGISSSTNDARTLVQEYKQKLATDLAAKAAAKVIVDDKAAVARAELAVQQSQQDSTVSTAARAPSAAAAPAGPAAAAAPAGPAGPKPSAGAAVSPSLGGTIDVTA